MTIRTSAQRDAARQAPAGIPAKFYRGLGLRAQGDIAGMTVYRTRRGKQVIFPKTYPKSPPGPLATRNQNRFRLAADAWTFLPLPQQRNWRRVARIAHLAITGYNLFIAWMMKGDRAAIKTLEILTGIALIFDDWCRL